MMASTDYNWAEPRLQLHELEIIQRNGKNGLTTIGLNCVSRIPLPHSSPISQFSTPREFRLVCLIENSKVMQEGAAGVVLSVARAKDDQAAAPGARGHARSEGPVIMLS